MSERGDICREAPDDAFLVALSSCHFMGRFNWVIFTPDFGVGGSGASEMLSGSIVVVSLHQQGLLVTFLQKTYG